MQSDKLLPLFNIAAREAQKVTMMALEQGSGMAEKEKVHVRLNVQGSAFECPGE